MRALLATPVGLALALGPGRARADQPRVHLRLEYTRSAGALACPVDATTLREQVAARMGYDPFEQPDATPRVTVTLESRGRGFVAHVERFDAAGEIRWSDTFPKPPMSSCAALMSPLASYVRAVVLPGVETAPLLGPTPAPALEPKAEPPPAREVPPPAPGVPAPPPMAVAPVPIPLRQPGVFEGRIGFGRALLLGVTAGTLATGSTFVLAANNKIDGARALGGSLRASTSSCTSSASARTAVCQQVADLVDAHDTYTDLGIASFIAAGVVGGLAATSIWIPRLASPTVQVVPAARGSLAGLTLRGSW